MTTNKGHCMCTHDGGSIRRAAGVAGGRRWFTLTRSTATDDVHGRIRLGFTWDVTARSLLQLKLGVLERIFAQRLEILCMLKPVLPQTALRWTTAFEQSKRDVQVGLVVTCHSHEQAAAAPQLAHHRGHRELAMATALLVMQVMASHFYPMQACQIMALGAVFEQQVSCAEPRHRQQGRLERFCVRA